MKNEALRDSLVQQAEENFLILTNQLDHAFDLVGFYLDRYPSDGSQSRRLKDRELTTTAENLAMLINQLAEVIKKWKHDEEQVLSRTGTEINVLNEIWANVNALIYFLISHGIDLEPFDLPRFTAAYYVLTRCNRLLT